MKLYIGIDPGKSGGIAVIAPEFIETFKLSATEGDIRDFLEDYKENSFCCIEKVGPARGRDGRQQGIASTAKFTESFGVVRGILLGLRIPFELVLPQKWQSYMSCMTKGDKNVTKNKAQQLWPNVKITHAIADALLIAEYGRRKDGAR